MADTIAFAEHILKPWDPEGSDYARITSLFHENLDEAVRFIRTVHDLHRYMLSFARSNPSSPVLFRADELMSIAINRLKKEFYQILAANYDRLDSDSVVSIEAYKRARSSGVQQGLARSGFDLSVSTVPVAGGEDVTVIQDRRLAGWVGAAPRIITTVFAGERLLSNFVFGEDTDSDNYSHAGTPPTVPISESCFTLIVREAALRLASMQTERQVKTLQECRALIPLPRTMNTSPGPS